MLVLMLVLRVKTKHDFNGSVWDSVFWDKNEFRSKGMTIWIMLDNDMLSDWDISIFSIIVYSKFYQKMRIYKMYLSWYTS